MSGDVSTVRLREDVTKGAGSRTAGLGMALKLLQVAEDTGADLDGAEVIPPVGAGTHFEDGVQRCAAEDEAEGRRLISLNAQRLTIDRDPPGARLVKGSPASPESVRCSVLPQQASCSQVIVIADTGRRIGRALAGAASDDLRDVLTSGVLILPVLQVRGGWAMARPRAVNTRPGVLLSSPSAAGHVSGHSAVSV